MYGRSLSTEGTGVSRTAVVWSLAIATKKVAVVSRTDHKTGSLNICIRLNLVGPATDPTSQLPATPALSHFSEV